LEGLDKTPGELQRYLDSRRDKRLGAYFEALVAFWLLHHPRLELLAQNVQIFHEGRTLGELDFLLRDGTEVVHLEVALKYYLGVCDEQRAYWVGPALRDRLDLKLAKLIDKQARLSSEETCRAQLRAGGLPLPTRQCIFLKGMLFSPERLAYRHQVLSGQQGTALSWTWGSLGDFEFSSEYTWEILEKPNWLAGRQGGLDRRLEPAQFLAAVSRSWERYRAPLLVAKRIKGSGYREESRHFIVPDEWHEQAIGLIQNSP
jgi:hypothetical protein